MTITHHVGDALDITRSLPDDSIDLVATSPPFLALRDYRGLPDQWGHEPTPAEFLDHLVDLVVELRRVLAPHGSVAVEIGDTYSGSGGAGGDYLPGGPRDGQRPFNGSAKYATENPRHSRSGRRRARRRDQAAGVLPADSRPGPAGRDQIPGWPLDKSLCGTPTLFAWSLAYGWNMLNPSRRLERWRVRNIICWARNNPMPGALADKYRPAVSYITVATVDRRRWFDLDAVRGPGAPPLDHWTDPYDGDTSWLINTVGSRLAHYAMWPAQLAERLVLSMCPGQVCRTCGEPRRREIRPEPYELTGATTGGVHAGNSGGTPVTGSTQFAANRRTTGWTDCGHSDWRPGVVLDPFAGTGTTLAVADLHGRDAIGIDLDPANADLHAPRSAEVKRSLFGVAPPDPAQLALISEATE